MNIQLQFGCIFHTHRELAICKLTNSQITLGELQKDRRGFAHQLLLRAEEIITALVHP